MAWDLHLVALAALDPPCALGHRALAQHCLVLKVGDRVETEAFLEVRDPLQVPSFQVKALGTLQACRVPWDPLPLRVDSLEAASAV